MTEKAPPGNENHRFAAPTPSSRLPDNLPGIDLVAFRDMIRGNDDMIRKLLGKFFDAYGGKAVEIGADVAAKALEAALKDAPEGSDIGAAAARSRRRIGQALAGPAGLFHIAGRLV